MPQDTIRVMLADDHEIVRSGLRMLLEAEADITVVAESSDLPSTRRLLAGNDPDVLVLDLNMGNDSSLTLIPEVVGATNPAAIVILTMQNDPVFAREALADGALAYVLKQAAGHELVEAIRSAVQGERYLSPSLGARLAATSSETESRPEGLSERELEVLRLIALGHTNAEIAERLFLSVRTVETHRAHIQRKTGRTTRAELVRFALDNRLLR